MQTSDEEEDQRTYLVVVNDEEQYSIWLADREMPAGWRAEGTTGPKAACLEHIGRVWTDMRPLSLRRKLEQWERDNANRPQPPPVEEPRSPVDDLVERLSVAQPVVASTRPRPDAGLLKAAIDRGYVHILFEKTGTELGVRLDPSQCSLDQANFEAGSGRLRLVGSLVLNYNRVRLESELELPAMRGTGHLVFIEAVRPGAGS